jgi:hypothetical protein
LKLLDGYRLLAGFWVILVQGTELFVQCVKQHSAQLPKALGTTLRYAQEIVHVDVEFGKRLAVVLPG